jgi:hypothetical protein
MARETRCIASLIGSAVAWAKTLKFRDRRSPAKRVAINSSRFVIGRGRTTSFSRHRRGASSRPRSREKLEGCRRYWDWENEGDEEVLAVKIEGEEQRVGLVADRGGKHLFLDGDQGRIAGGEKAGPLLVDTLAKGSPRLRDSPLVHLLPVPGAEAPPILVGQFLPPAARAALGIEPFAIPSLGSASD